MTKKRKIKILVLSHISDLLGGAERSLIDTLDDWNEKFDIEVEFILRKPILSMAQSLDKRGWKYYSLDYTFWSNPTEINSPQEVFRQSVHNSRAVVAIQEIIKETKPDVVMTNSIVCPWAALAAYYQDTPHIWFVREYGDLDHGRVFEIGREKTFEDIDSMSDLVVTNSKTLGDHVKRYVDKSKVTALYTPFKIEEFRKKSRKIIEDPFNNPKSLKLVIVGNLAPSKGHLEVVEAVGRLKQKGIEVELCIVGSENENSYAKSIKSTIKKYKLKNIVHITGRQANPFSYISRADIGVMSSRMEAFGRVTFEYLALGKPVIGANTGATPEMIKDGQNGLVYKHGSVEDLVKAIEKYANNRDLIKKHGQMALKTSKDMMGGLYSSETLYGKVLEVIDSPKSNITKPINYLHRWFDYVESGQTTLDTLGVFAIARIFRMKLRHYARVSRDIIQSKLNKNKDYE